MPVIDSDPSCYPESIRKQLEKFAAEWPDRDFWYVFACVSPGSWSSRPCGQGAADIIRYSPDDLRTALETTAAAE